MQIKPVYLLWIAVIAYAASAFLVADNKSLVSVATDEPVVALTFDDGPHITNTPKLLDILRSEGVKATFFVTGMQLEKHPGITQRTVKEGHEIGNHTYTHPRLPKLESTLEIKNEITRSQALIKDTIGFSPTIFRAPYLAQDKRVSHILSELGLLSIGRSVATSDWKKGITTEEIIHNACINTKNGDIILMHDYKEKAIESIPSVIRKLKDKGFRFVTISELLALKDEA
jgi:peptidoglycan/xylan/chitin deacetylase (PgdA/CDA1 family)